jgi:hypothetical protein
VAIAVAVLLPVLIGFAGLGVEVGLWFAIQRQNQSAADAAAISAALEYAAHTESGVPIDSAGAAAISAGYNLFNNANCSTSGTTNCTLSLCYRFKAGSTCNTSNPNGMLPDAVQVSLTQPVNTTFANLVTAIWGPNVNTVNVTTKAIAAFPTTGTACNLALDPAAPDAIRVDGGALPNSNCWVASNSSSGSALSCNGCTIAGPTNVVGGDAVSNGGQLNGSPNRTYASAIADPYASTLTHAFLTAGMPTAKCNQPTVTGPPGTKTYTYPQTGNCIISNPSIPPRSTVVLAPRTLIDGGLALNGPGSINLAPGTYWVTDGTLSLNGLTGDIVLTCSACSPGGPGVTIIFTEGSAGTIGTFAESGNVTTVLYAPSSGANAGLLMVQDAVAPATSDTIGGNGGSVLSGLVYFPKGSLNFVGNIQVSTSKCLVAVANSLSMTGNISFDASGCPAGGLTTVPTVLSVFLADSHG